MFIQAMTSTTYTFDEGKFISRFISDYYTETDFDLKNSFNEYYQNFISSNSADYNATIFIRCYLKERLLNRSIQIDYDTFLYEKLFDIIKKGMGM